MEYIDADMQIKPENGASNAKMLVEHLIIRFYYCFTFIFLLFYEIFQIVL